MNKFYYFYNGLVLTIVLLTSLDCRAQEIYQPYSYQFYQKLSTPLYTPSLRVHTALKDGFLSDSSLVNSYQAVITRQIGTGPHHSWLHRKVFDEHLIDTHGQDFEFYMDFLPNPQIGREFRGRKTTWTDSRGYQAGGNIGNKFWFYTSGYENQAKYPAYIDQYISSTGMVTGQAYDRTAASYLGNAGLNTHDWSYVTAVASYKPINALQLTLANDKIFIGDGYRSLLLSDLAANYPNLRVSVDLGRNIRYTYMVAMLEDQRAFKFDGYTNNRRKWAAFHYMDWNATNRFSIGFFNAMITEQANDQGVSHGFDVNYLNPLIYSSRLGPANQLPDHTLAGLNLKYKFLQGVIAYGQLVDDNFASNATQRYAYQIGLREAELFNVKRLNWLFEFNTAAPYTYSSQNSVSSYTNFSENLTDPFGANYREYISLINYSAWRFDFQLEMGWTKYGANKIDNNLITNFGNDPTLSNTSGLPVNQPHFTTQGVLTSNKYAEATIACLLNPKSNMRLELGALYRNQTGKGDTGKTLWLTFGLRSSFRNLYHDF